MNLVVGTILRCATFKRYVDPELKVYLFVTLRPVDGVTLRVRSRT